MHICLQEMPCFGVAGNFTGHLEQAGEARDFSSITTKEENAPKALFPTYIPEANENVPDYLKTFPFSDSIILFPEGEEKVQIEPECAIVFKLLFTGNKISGLKAVCFGASNDCSIRKEGAKKISVKKNWGKASKGFAKGLISCDSFTADGVISRYRIASFLIRQGQVYDYGEDSAISGYSYNYARLEEWIVDRLNNQDDTGPCENLSSYLSPARRYTSIFVSVGATRYTEFGQTNFLKTGDVTAVAVYPDKYTHDQIKEYALLNKAPSDISLLCQKIVVG